MWHSASDISPTVTERGPRRLDFDRTRAVQKQLVFTCTSNNNDREENFSKYLEFNEGFGRVREAEQKATAAYKKEKEKRTAPQKRI